LDLVNVIDTFRWPEQRLRWIQSRQTPVLALESRSQRRRSWMWLRLKWRGYGPRALLHEPRQKRREL